MNKCNDLIKQLNYLVMIKYDILDQNFSSGQKSAPKEIT